MVSLTGLDFLDSFLFISDQLQKPPALSLRKLNDSGLWFFCYREREILCDSLILNDQEMWYGSGQLSLKQGHRSLQLVWEAG